METWVWGSVAVIGALAVLGALHAMALQICRDEHLHDLKVHVATLRITYIEQSKVAAEKEEIVAEEIVEKRRAA